MAAYKPSRRRLQAEATERDIVQAARQLFAQNGYSRTSMGQIAAEAGVAIQTIYASVGSKRDLLARMTDLIDQESGRAELEAEMAAAPDPRALLALCIRLTRQVAERCGDIITAVYAAARFEPEMAAVLEEGRRRHREGTRGVAEALAGAKSLAPGLSADTAARQLAVLTYSETYFLLTSDFQMSYDDAEAWVREAVEVSLFGRHQS